MQKLKNDVVRPWNPPQPKNSIETSAASTVSVGVVDLSSVSADATRVSVHAVKLVKCMSLTNTTYNILLPPPSF